MVTRHGDRRKSLCDMSPAEYRVSVDTSLLRESRLNYEPLTTEALSPCVQVNRKAGQQFENI